MSLGFLIIMSVNLESPWDSSVPLEQLFTTQNRQGTGVQHVLVHAPRRGDPQRLTTYGRVEKNVIFLLHATPPESHRYLKDTEITWQRHLNGTIMVSFSLRLGTHCKNIWLSILWILYINICLPLLHFTHIHLAVFIHLHTILTEAWDRTDPAL